jgi:glycosyltransferase 2 family protein
MPARASVESTALSSAEGQPKVSRWRRWFLALIMVAAVVVAALHWGDVEKFAELASTAKPMWLLGALLLQFGTYVFLSLEWSLVLKSGGSPLSFWSLIPLTITKLFADQVVPTAGVSGNILLVDRLVDRGVPRKNAVAAVILAIIAYYASYAACALVTVALLWLFSDISWWLIAIVSLFFVVAAAIPTAALWLHGKGSRGVPGWLRRFDTVRELLDLIGEAPKELVRNPRLIGQLALLNGAVFVADAATLQFCLLALGAASHFVTSFVALIMASIVVTLGPIPLGLGTFEGTSIAMLRLLGISFEVSLSATLLFRGFALWLPLITGLFLSRREWKRR